jgi:hypothetical protein
MALAPIMPAAPALLSTAIGCFRIRDATWLIARMEASAVPPAGQGQMKVIGRDGYSSARAMRGRTRPEAVAAVAAAPARSVRRLMRTVESKVIVFLTRWMA